MSDSVRPRRQQPTRLPRPWDSPGKNGSPGVGCHFLLQCMKVECESEVSQSCLTLSYPMDCSLLGSSIHGIFQAKVLEWGAIAVSAYHHEILFNKCINYNNKLKLSLILCLSVCFVFTSFVWNSCPILKHFQNFQRMVTSVTALGNSETPPKLMAY